jgi:D-alanine-D-alanine ligase
MRIAMLMGGANTERDVSLASGIEVAGALRAAGHEVANVDIATEVDTSDGIDVLFVSTDPSGWEIDVDREPPTHDEIAELRARHPNTVFAPGVLDVCRRADLVYPLVYSDEGEGGYIQAVLELCGLAYVGPNPLGCSISFDKVTAKRLCRDSGLATPQWRVLGADDDADAVDFEGPWVVKPVSGGSTIGVALVNDRDDLVRALVSSRAYGADALVEERIDGREFSLGVIGDDPLAVVEISTDRELFDYVAKYQEGNAEEVCPAPQTTAHRHELQRLAVQAHGVLAQGSHAASRMDFLQDDDGQFYFLECNGLPGMTATSLFPKSAAGSGMDLSQVCDRIVRLAHEARVV